jgi:hypothetical protein
MPSTGDTGRQRPFQNGDQFESSSTHVLEDQDHPFMRQLNEAIGSHTLDEVIQLVSEWKRVSQLPPHHGPADDPVGALGPALFHAIRADRFDVVAYLLDQGVKPSRLALWEAVSCKSSSAMWQVFLDHGLDINAPLEDSGTSPLG